MIETPKGGGRFTEVILNPIVTVTQEHIIVKANELLKKVYKLCFIVISLKLTVKHEVSAVVG